MIELMRSEERMHAMNRLGLISFLAAGALGLAACHHTSPPEKRAGPQIVIAKQACEIDTLAKKHKVIIAKLEVEKDLSVTLPQKLLDYRAEVDASYRFVVEHCNNYNMCMQAHEYKEEACKESRSAWAESHKKFNDLTESLAKLEAQRPKPKDDHSGDDEPDDVWATGDGEGID